MVGQELAQDLGGLGGEEWGPLQPPRPLCPSFLLSNEGESKWQTRTRILAHKARGRRPRRQGQEKQSSEPVQGTERRGQRDRRARDSKAPRRALEGGYQGTGWEREDKSLILRT